jgi:SHS2 domain-containing protein
MAKEKKFEWLDITTSDVAFRAHGKGLSEMFANAGLAVFEVILDTKLVRPKEKRHIILHNSKGDLKTLMFDWISELIYFVDAENLAFSKFDVKVDEKENRLVADVWGDKIDPEKHQYRTHVKACTYHKMEIKKGKGWTAQVILDI